MVDVDARGFHHASLHLCINDVLLSVSMRRNTYACVLEKGMSLFNFEGSYSLRDGTSNTLLEGTFTAFSTLVYPFKTDR